MYANIENKQNEIIYVLLNVQVPTSIFATLLSAKHFSKLHYTNITKQSVVDYANHESKLLLTAYFHYAYCMVLAMNDETKPFAKHQPIMMSQSIFHKYKSQDLRRCQQQIQSCCE